MPLEDHVGDVISKARVAAGMEIQTAAQTAGLNAGEYEQLEETGRCARSPIFSQLAAALSLNGEKLRHLFEGWEPPVIDPSRWRHLRVITTRNPRMAVNCFLVWDHASHEAALFDTGFEAAPILDLTARFGLTIVHLFITHTHADHVAALEPLRAQYPGAKLHSNSKHAPLNQRNRPGEAFELASLRIESRETPGHADDGATYLVTGWPDGAPMVAVAGDAIFAGSMGGARQNSVLAKQKIREEILSLPGETLICPGHGPLTTVGLELSNNPFF